jgi:pyrroline-5-carboxylate reductase
MQRTSVGFIGAGRVARIILGGWKRFGKMPSRVVLYDHDAGACRSLKSMAPEVEIADAAADAAACDIVFLAVHPLVVKDVMPELKPHLKAGAVLVSLAPKFTIAKLSEMLGGFDRLMRMIPNAPSVVGKGLNPVTFAPAVDAGDRDAILQMLGTLGDCPEVPEEQLEGYAIIAAMGPTYFWPQLYQLESLTESFGLSPDAAMEGLDRMLWGTVATMKDSGLSPDQVQDLIPVKPMADEVQELCEAYEHKLQGLMQKIRP